jgi:hypothetical protein
MASRGMTHTPSLITINSGIRVILRVIHQQFEMLYCWYYWWEGFVMYTFESGLRWHDTYEYTSSFMKIGTGVQAILRFFSQIWWAVMLALLLGWIYELCYSDWLRCIDTHTRFHKDWLNHSKLIGGDIHTDTHRHTDTKTAMRSHKLTLIFTKKGKWAKMRGALFLCPFNGLMFIR